MDCFNSAVMDITITLQLRVLASQRAKFGKQEADHPLVVKRAHVAERSASVKGLHRHAVLGCRVRMAMDVADLDGRSEICAAAAERHRDRQAIADAHLVVEAEANSARAEIRDRGSQ